MVTAPITRPHSAFEGPESLRVRAEWPVLLWSLLAIGLAAPLIAFFFPVIGSVKEVALLLIGAMVYVTLARGQLIGGSIRVHPGQFGHVHEIALECSQALSMVMPNIFVRDDPFVPLVAVGMGEPYSLIISAQWVEHLTPGELRFLIGRELAHIAAGHTRITSLLSVNGRENPIVSMLFGAWLRRIEYTADRAGLLCCRSLDQALSAISISAFHLVGRKIDVAAFAEQHRELQADRTLRAGEWISAMPYATNRIAALRAFARDPVFLNWTTRFEQARLVPVAPPLNADDAGARRTFASFPRRIAALTIDAIVVAAIAPKLPDMPHWLTVEMAHDSTLRRIVSTAAEAGSMGPNLLFFVYIVILVGIVGQTLGMMIVDLRVVNDRFARIGIVQALWRYVCFIGSVAAVVGIWRIFARVQPFERWSATRLVDGGAAARGRSRKRYDRAIAR